MDLLVDGEEMVANSSLSFFSKKISDETHWGHAASPIQTLLACQCHAFGSYFIHKLIIMIRSPSLTLWRAGVPALHGEALDTVRAPVWMVHLPGESMIIDYRLP